MSAAKKSDVEVLSSKVFSLRWRKGWYWHLDIHPYQQTAVHDVIAITEAVRRFHEGKKPSKSPLLIHRGFASSPQLDALLHYSKAAAELASAIAYVVSSVDAEDSSALVQRWFLRDLPVRIFHKEKDAVAWLEQFAGES